MSDRKSYRASENNRQFTKYCLDPWSFLLVQSNGDVKPCCWQSAIGSVLDGHRLDALATSERMNKLRMSLLVGRLDSHCQNCPAREDVDAADFQWLVHEYIADRFGLYQVSQGMLLDRATGSRVQPGSSVSPY